MISLLFFGALALLGWTYFGYAVYTAIAARLWPRPFARDDNWHPRVSVIIPARDEATVIGRKLDSVLGQGWPALQLDVVVVDDGSSDGTADVVRRYGPRGVRLVRLVRSQGKAVALNVGVRDARGDVLVLTDARQPLCPGAIAALVAPLADATVGAVSGELALAEDTGGGGLGMYRRMDDQVRRWEAATGSAVGVTGALWALRRSLWTPLPRGTLLDDLHQPVCVAGAGSRVVIAPEARALDVAAPGGQQELGRRIRTLAGNLQMLRALPWTLSPRRNPLFFRLLSHKVLRLCAPAALATLLVTNLLLADGHILFAALLVAQIVCYGLAAYELPARVGGVVGRVARMARAFVLLHVAVALAWWEFVRGRERDLWRGRGADLDIGVPVPTTSTWRRADAGSASTSSSSSISTRTRRHPAAESESTRVQDAAPSTQ